MSGLPPKGVSAGWGSLRTAGGVLLLRWVNGVSPLRPYYDRAFWLCCPNWWLAAPELEKMVGPAWPVLGACPSGAGLECPALGTEEAVPYAKLTYLVG